MKTIPVSSRSKVVAALLAEARRGALILRDAAGREYVLAEVDEFGREIELARQDDDLMRFLDDRGRQAASLSLGEAKERLGLR